MSYIITFFEELSSLLFGKHGLVFHIGGLLLSLTGALLAKAHFWKTYEKSNSFVVFERKKWFSENWLDLTISLLVSFLIVRFLDIFMIWAVPKIESTFEIEIPITDDVIFYYLMVGIFVQIWIHKKYRKKKD